MTGTAAGQQFLSGRLHIPSPAKPFLLCRNQGFCLLKQHGLSIQQKSCCRCPGRIVNRNNLPKRFLPDFASCSSFLFSLSCCFLFLPYMGFTAQYFSAPFSCLNRSLRRQYLLLSSRAGILDLFRHIRVLLVKVVLEHLSQFGSCLIISCLISPCVSRIHNLCRSTWAGLRHVYIKYIVVFVLSLLQLSV